MLFYNYTPYMTRSQIVYTEINKRYARDKREIKESTPDPCLFLVYPGYSSSLTLNKFWRFFLSSLKYDTILPLLYNGIKQEYLLYKEKAHEREQRNQLLQDL